MFDGIQLRAMILACGFTLGMLLRTLFPKYADSSQVLPPARPYISPPKAEPSEKGLKPRTAPKSLA